MDRIPVGATIAHAYRFAVGDFFGVLKRVWLVWAISCGLDLFFLREPSDPMLRQIYNLMQPAYLIFGMLLLAMQAVLVSRYALGLESDTIPTPLTLEPSVRKLLMGYLLLTFLTIAVLSVVIFIPLQGFSPGTDRNTFLYSFTAVASVSCGALLLVLVRLSFLLAPVCAAENILGLSRAWRLSKGNFWRALYIAVCTAGPITLSMALLLYLTYFHDIPGWLGPSTVENAWEIAVANRLHAYWYIFYPVDGILTTLFLGLIFGAQSFAYRALVPENQEAEAFS